MAVADLLDAAKRQVDRGADGGEVDVGDAGLCADAWLDLISQEPATGGQVANPHQNSIDNL